MSDFEALKIDFIGCCQAGKNVIYQQVIQDRLDITEFLEHARTCEQCVKYLSQQLRPLAKSAIRLIPKLAKFGR